jgi:hypothetical protein
MVAIPLVSSTPAFAEASQIIGTLNTFGSSIANLLSPAGAGSLSGAVFLPAGSSQVNLVSLAGGATGSPAVITVGGPSAGTSVDLILGGNAPAGVVGLGGIVTNAAGAALQVARNSTSVNGLAVSGAASGSDPQLSAFGSGSHLNILLTPKGTGTIKFGSTGPVTANGTVAATFTATSAPTGASTSIQRWLNFIDSTGRVGYIPVF